MIGHFEFQDYLEQIFRSRNALKKLPLYHLNKMHVFGDVLEITKNSLEFETCSFQIEKHFQVLRQLQNQHEVQFYFYYSSQGNFLEKNGFEIYKNFQYELKKLFMAFKFQSFLKLQNQTSFQVEFSRIIQKNSYLKQHYFTQFQSFIEQKAAQYKINLFQSPQNTFSQILCDFQNCNSNKKIILGSPLVFLLDPDITQIICNYDYNFLQVYDLNLLASTFGIQTQQLRNLLLQNYLYYQSYQRHDHPDIFYLIKNQSTKLYKMFKSKQKKRIYEITFLISHLQKDSLHCYNPIICLENLKQIKNLSTNKLIKTFDTLFSSHVYERVQNKIIKFPRFYGKCVQNEFAWASFQNLIEPDFSEILQKTSQYCSTQQVISCHYTEMEILQKKYYQNCFQILLFLICSGKNQEKFQKVSFRYRDYYSQNIFKLKNINSKKKYKQIYYCEDMPKFSDSIQNFLQKKELEQSINLQTMLNTVYINTLDFFGAICIENESLSQVGEMLIHFQQSGYFEQGLLFLQYLKYNFFQQECFFSSDITNWYDRNQRQSNDCQHYLKQNAKYYQNFTTNIFDFDEIEFFQIYFPDIKLVRSQQHRYFQFLWDISLQNPTQFFHPHQDSTFLFIFELTMQIKGNSNELKQRQIWNDISKVLKPFYATVHLISIFYSFFDVSHGAIYQDQRSKRISDTTNFMKKQIKQTLKTFLYDFITSQNCQITIREVTKIIKMLPTFVESSSEQISQMKILVYLSALSKKNLFTEELILYSKKINVNIQKIISNLEDVERFVKQISNLNNKQKFQCLKVFNQQVQFELCLNLLRQTIEYLAYQEF